MAKPIDDDAFDGLLAQGLVAAAFMAETIRVMAHRDADRDAFAAAFMMRLHARIDRTEAPPSLGADEFEGVRRKARTALAQLAEDLASP